MKGGSRKRTIVTNAAGDWESPSWGPDGRHVVCSRFLNGRRELYMVDTRHGKLRPITQNGNHSLPSWSANLPPLTPSMTQQQNATAALPPPPATVFLVGIGGIGMSGLAQALLAQGYAVAGSDRLLEGPGRTELLDKLRRTGISIFPQNGSGPAAVSPDAVVISAAVEPGNPDLKALPNLPVLHRARALASVVDRGAALQIAVAGSAGKTSVTGWLASALRALGHRVLAVNGGYMIDAQSATCPGNYSTDPNPEIAVIEVDESDRSLVEFTPHVGVLLNVGNLIITAETSSCRFSAASWTAVGPPACCRRTWLRVCSAMAHHGACSSEMRTRAVATW